jgi:hypothetical protein
VLEVTDGAIYMAITLRNVGNGLAVLDRWDLSAERATGDRSPGDLGSFRRLTRDIYVPAGDLGFWQGALRDPDDAAFQAAREAISGRRAMSVDLLYGDHEGGQHTISRFALLPQGDEEWVVTVSRHWNLDRADPR